MRFNDLVTKLCLLYVSDLNLSREWEVSSTKKRRTCSTRWPLAGNFIGVFRNAHLPPTSAVAMIASPRKLSIILVLVAAIPSGKAAQVKAGVAISRRFGGCDDELNIKPPTPCQ